MRTCRLCIRVVHVCVNVLKKASAFACMSMHVGVSVCMCVCSCVCVHVNHMTM